MRTDIVAAVSHPVTMQLEQQRERDERIRRRKEAEAAGVSRGGATEASLESESGRASRKRGRSANDDLAVEVIMC